MKCTFDIEPVKPFKLEQKNEAQEKVENSKEKEIIKALMRNMICYSVQEHYHKIGGIWMSIFHICMCNTRPPSQFFYSSLELSLYFPQVPSYATKLLSLSVNENKNQQKFYLKLLIPQTSDWIFSLRAVCAQPL